MMPRFNELWRFVQNVGEVFLPTYVELVNRNRNHVINDLNRQWQKLRRGRYVEFNLVYDKGTKFGLDTNGRTESILMSLPPEADWMYDHKPQPGSEESKTLENLTKSKNWLIDG